MKIGIVGPFNPASVAEYFDEARVPSINEAATAVNTLVREFVEQGHIVYVFTLSTLTPNTYRVLIGEKVRVYLIPTGLFPKLLGYHQLVIAPFFLPRRIAKIIKKECKNLDVLHAHWTYEYAKALTFLSDAIPSFDTVRDWCPYQMAIQKTSREKLDWKLKSIIFKDVMSDNNITFIANSHYTYRLLSVSYPNKVCPIIPNPIDKNWIIEEKRYHSHLQFISIATGLFSPRKNIETLLRAFQMFREQHNDACLHLVGDYNESKSQYLLWKEHHLLDGVLFYGPLPHSELINLLDRMSCLVHPSLEETFGNILLEAMSRCVPCIGGKDAGAVPEVLRHGKCGLICDVSRPESIYEAMEEICLPSVVARIQRDATAMLKENYSSDNIAKKHIALYSLSKRT